MSQRKFGDDLDRTLSPTQRGSLAWSPWGAGSSHWSDEGQSRSVSSAEGSVLQGARSATPSGPSGAQESYLSRPLLTRFRSVLELDVSQELLRQSPGADIIAYGAVIGACAKAPSQAQDLARISKNF